MIQSGNSQSFSEWFDFENVVIFKIIAKPKMIRVKNAKAPAHMQSAIVLQIKVLARLGIA